MTLELLPPLPDIMSTRSKDNAVVVTGVRGYHQLEQFSCGASVVATIVAAYSGSLESTDWDRIVGTTKPDHNGTPSRRVLKSLREFGFTPTKTDFNARSVGSSITHGDLLITSMRMPSQPASETHWVVIAGCSKDEVLILNATGAPLFSKRWVDWETANRARTNSDTVYRIDTGLTTWVRDRRGHSPRRK